MLVRRADKSKRLPVILLMRYYEKVILFYTGIALTKYYGVLDHNERQCRVGQVIVVFNFKGVEMNIKELNKRNIELANSNSFFNRGTNTENAYKEYANEINSFNISYEKKEKWLNKLHSIYEAILYKEANYVSVMVAGPARYNYKRENAKADRIMSLSGDVVDFMNSIREQIKHSKIETKDDKIIKAVKNINTTIEIGFTWLLKDDLVKLAAISTEEFIKQFERLDPIYKFPKSTKAYKMYAEIKSGKNFEIENKIDFENEDYTIIIKGERVFIYFKTKPAQQLIYALKSHKYWWNSNEHAWSTYLKNYDAEWSKSISEKYSKYI